jgi:hypothetical protein
MTRKSRYASHIGEQAVARTCSMLKGKAIRPEFFANHHSVAKNEDKLKWARFPACVVMDKTLAHKRPSTMACTHDDEYSATDSHGASAAFRFAESAYSINS